MIFLWNIYNLIAKRFHKRSYNLFIKLRDVENNMSNSNDFQKIIINSNTVCSKKGFKEHTYPTIRYREILNCFKFSGKKT